MMDGWRPSSDYIKRLVASAGRIGLDATDSDETALRKRLAVVLCAGTLPLTILWSAIYLAVGAPLAAAIPGFYSVFTPINTAIFARTRNFGFYRSSQLLMILILPWLVLMSLGGFRQSSVVIIWAALCPLGSLLLEDLRRTLLWIGGFAVLLIVSALLQPYLVPAHLPEAFVTWFFVLNVGFVIAIAFGLLYFFVGRLRQRTRELTESLERQTATAGVLQVISSSPGDLEPVFASMLENAVRICGASFGNIYRWDGDALNLAATHNIPAAFGKKLVQQYRPGPGTPAGRMVASKSVVHVADLAADEAYTEREPITVAAVERGGVRTLLVVPMLKENELIGALALDRQEMRPFTDKQVELVQNFAAQAVIAIENARLLSELRESLEQQTATAEVLKVISSSPGALEPVFASILANATEICAARFGTLFLREGEALRVAAHHGSLTKAWDEQWRVGMVLQPDAELQAFQTLWRGQSLQVADLSKAPSYLARNPKAVNSVEVGGIRTMVTVPMLKDAETVGVITIFRTEVREFDEKQIALVTNFAAQAVIAIENARLLTELRQSLEQQTATAKVLQVISRSAFDLPAVFETVVESSARLCAADRAIIHRFDGELLRVSASFNAPPAEKEWLQQHPIRPGPDSGAGRAALGRRTIHNPDILADPAHTLVAKHAEEARPVLSVRSILWVPILKGNDLLGVLSLWHAQVKPFTDKQIALVETFADQAAIAIENVRLFEAEQQRTKELSESLEQQTATAEVLRVISSSPGDLEPVFAAMLENAVRICGAKFGNIYRYDQGLFHLVAAHNTPPALAEARRGAPQRPADNMMFSRLVATKVSVQVPDVSVLPNYLDRSDMAAVTAVELGGVRTALVVPMLKEGDLIGAFSLFRDEVLAFNDKQVALVSSFAAQAVIAIENARLLSELRESLEQQTATAEVLQAISSSPGDLSAVFDGMLAKATRLCQAKFGMLWLADGDGFRAVAFHGVPAALARERQREEVVHFDGDTPLARLAGTKRLVHVTDITQEPAYKNGFRPLVELADIGGARTLLLVPMLNEDALVGVIAIYRPEVRPFREKQIALVESFAAQAVIAIENARLLTELRESLEQQTATSDLLSVISASPGDLEPVFHTMLENASRICQAQFGVLSLREGAAMRVVAMHNPPAAYAELRRREPIWMPTGLMGRIAAEAAATKQAVQVPDLVAYSDEDPLVRVFASTTAARSLIVVPLLKEGEVIGLSAIYRQEVRPFADKQIELLTSFAAQAVIAIENTRLLTELRQRTADLTESLAQQTATSEVLRVISSSPGDLEPVFAAMLENAVRICEAKFGNIYRWSDGVGELAAAYNTPPALAAARRRSPLSDRTIGIVGRMRESKTTVHITDLAADQYYLDRNAPAVAAVELGGARTIMAVPMLKDAELIGSFTLYRQEVRPFTDKQIALVTSFAAQAVIAIENARLLNELRQRTDELSRSVEELRALGETAQAVNSTLDLETVLSTIVAKAVQLSGTEAGAIYVFDEGEREFLLRATYGMDQALINALTHQHLGLDDPNLEKMLAQAGPVQAADLTREPASPANEIVTRAGYRARLVAPLIRDEKIVGMLVVRRRTPGAFAENTVELMKTFAAQSALAIQNARLFHEIEDKGRQLEVASRHKSQFLANMSHELRTPLNAILGYTELILDNIYGEAPEKMRGVLERVQTNGKHLLGLINDVLDLSKIEAGQLTLSLTDYSLAELVQGVFVAVEPLAAQKNLALTTKVAKGLPVGHGDERRLAQVLLNLVGNAIKFTDKGEVAIEASLADGAFNVAVRDSGPGIAAADQAKIFEEFQQVDNTSTRQKGGTGLGLAISKRIVEMHGGRILVDSALGKGATFTIRLPANAGTKGRAA